ncbi:MAG: ABC transporter permease [Prevotella sp.]|jgi:ABC-2 type transport system permease protein
MTLFQQIKEGLTDMLYIWAKEIRNVFTDEGVLIFFILVPIGYPLLYSWIYNNEVVREVPVAVVDMDHSAMSREFIRKLDASPDVKVAYYCNSIDDGKDLVGRQVVRGVIYLPSDFSKKVNRSQQSYVSVYCDMNLMLAYKAIYQSSQAVASLMSSQIQLERSVDFNEQEDLQTTAPVQQEAVNIFNSTIGYGNAIIPPVLMLILHQTLLLGIGLAAGTARENNRFSDLVPISHHYNGIFRIVMGKSLCYFMIYMVMGTYVGICVPRFFSFTAMNHAEYYFPFLIPFLLATIFFGMTISGVVRHRENILLLVVFTSVPLLFLSGVSWPISNLPAFWKYFSYLFPSTFGLRGYMTLSSMGGTLNDIEFEYKGLWIQVFVYLFLTCLVYRRQINLSHTHSRKRIDHIKEILKTAKEGQ